MSFKSKANGRIKAKLFKLKELNQIEKKKTINKRPKFYSLCKIIFFF